jgi:hypothetical protein
MPMFSPDGVMDADGAQACAPCSPVDGEGARATIDLSKTYTNEFIDGR